MNYQYGQNFEFKDNNYSPILSPGEWLNIRLPKSEWRIKYLDEVFRLVEETTEDEKQVFSLFVKEKYSFEDKDHIVELVNKNQIWKIYVRIVSG